MIWGFCQESFILFFCADPYDRDIYGISWNIRGYRIYKLVTFMGNAVYFWRL